MDRVLAARSLAERGAEGLLTASLPLATVAPHLAAQDGNRPRTGTPASQAVVGRASLEAELDVPRVRRKARTEIHSAI